MPADVILIAAVTVDGYIARHNLEVTSWSKDIHLFKDQTIGSTIIMGSNTYSTLSAELEGRKTIVIHRNEDPRAILSSIKEKRCFVIGGGKTYFRFAPYITHVYVTPHPYVFGEGVPLFDGTPEEMKLVFEKLITVSDKDGIYQYQYKVFKE
mgnify:CR=1 FL=1